MLKRNNTSQLVGFWEMSNTLILYNKTRLRKRSNIQFHFILSISFLTSQKDIDWCPRSSSYLTFDSVFITCDSKKKEIERQKDRKKKEIKEDRQKDRQKERRTKNKLVYIWLNTSQYKWSKVPSLIIQKLKKIKHICYETKKKQSQKSEKTERQNEIFCKNNCRKSV